MKTAAHSPHNDKPGLRGAFGRADLLLALKQAEHDPARQAALAAVLGFSPKPANESDKNPRPDDPAISVKPPPVAVVPEKAQEQPQILFRPYRLVTIETAASQDAWQHPVPDSAETGTLNPHDRMPWDVRYPVPQARPVVPWTRLWPRLREAVARPRWSALDLPRLTQQLARGKAVRRLPRTLRLSWPNPLPVILDFSDRLTPYWSDWHWLQRQLHNRLHQQIRCYRLHGVPQQPVQRLLDDGHPEARFIAWPRLGQGSTLLIVSDLGMNDPAHPWPIACWHTKLSELKRRGVRVIVLAPASMQRLAASVVNLAGVVRLSPDSCLRPLRRLPSIATATTGQPLRMSTAAATLFAMMSVATRIEPGLLRELRSYLPDGHRDAGIEGEVWCQPELDTAATACAIAAWAVQGWREQFGRLPEALQRRTRDGLRAWHAHLPQLIHHEETLVWRHLTTTEISGDEHVHTHNARTFFDKLANTLQAAGNQGLLSQARMVQLADRHVHWVTPVLAQKESYVERLSKAVVQAEPARGQRGLPEGIDPVEWLKISPALAPQRMQLSQDPNRALRLAPAAHPLSRGATPLATVEIDRDTLLWAERHPHRLPVYRPWPWNTATPPVLPQPLQTVTPTQTPPPPPRFILHSGRERLQVEPFTPPAWASAWGQDGFGLFAEFTVQAVTQRLRWVVPGTFTMGSPQSEAGRHERETQHDVTLKHGFWLADSACTQALWIAVMGNNPSHFQNDSNNPVEKVSWLDVQQFMERLNAVIPDLNARLPSEAEWEYACRAGTTTAFSCGETITPELANYFSGDDENKWYKSKTVPVKSLPPNPWGLFEMHGNVWEWTQDCWHDDYQNAPADGSAWLEQGACGQFVRRVVRGGSWDDGPQDLRSADRDGGVTDGAYYFLGFRIARVF